MSQVQVACGAEEELSHVEEPNRCEYTAEFLTPAACTRQEADALAAQLEQVETEATHLSTAGHEEL